jgi:hypothetical protein
MRRNLLLALAGLLLAPLLPVLSSGPAHAATAQGPAATTAHPRLLFSAADVADLRARVAVPTSVHAAAWKRLKEKADGHLLRVSPDVVRANLEVPLYDVKTPYTPNGIEGQGLQKPYLLQGEMTSYLLELGLAYQISGDERYGRHTIELLRALGDAGWPFWTGGVDLGIGDLAMGVGLGFDWTYQLMTPEERTEIVRSITAHQETLLVRSLFEYHNEASEYRTSNWSGVLGGGTGLLLLAIRGEPEAPSGHDSPPGPTIPNIGGEFPARHYEFDDYLSKAVLKAGNYFRYGFDALGAGDEGHTYANYGLNRATPFAIAARREGVADILAGTGARNIARWRSLEQLPGEGQNFVPLNDSARTAGTVDFEAMMFAIAPDNGVAQWNWRRTVGELGEDYYNDTYVPAPVADEACPVDRWAQAPLVSAACPALLHTAHVWAILFYRTPTQTPEVDPGTTGPESVHYDANGLVDARTGFGRGAGEVVSTFQARRNGEPPGPTGYGRTGHFQWDSGNFTLYGDGAHWAIDPGSACVSCGKNYGEGPEEGHPTFHNVIVIDGSKLTQSNKSRYFDGATIDSFVNGPNVSLAHADMRYAYSRDPEISFDPPFAGRDHLFSRVPGRPVVVGIADELERDSVPFPRSYQWQMITDKTNSVAAAGSGFTISALSGATLVGRSARAVHPTTAATTATDPTFTVDPIVFNNNTDDSGPHHKISTTTAPQQKLEQVTVLAVTPAGTAPATTAVLRLNGANAVAVDWAGTREVFLRKVRAADNVTGEVQTDARIAKFLKDQGETVMRDGRALSAYGRDYVTVSGSAATVTVSGAAAQATGPASNTYRVFAPQAVSLVTVNGTPVRSCRSGDYLTFPCVATTRLALSAPATAPATDPVSLSAVLSSEGTPLSGRTLTFAVGALTQTAVTDGAGRAQVSVDLDVDPGSYDVTAAFSAAPGFAASSATAALDVVADPTTLVYTGETTASGDTIDARALLTEDGGVALAGRVIAFAVQGRTVTAVTDAQGQAAATLHAPGHGRIQTVSAAFTGESRRSASSAVAVVTWGRRSQ